MKYAISGVEFEVNQESIDSFGYLEGNDTGPFGPIEEMRQFVDRTKSCRCLIDVGALFGIFSLAFTSRPGTVAYALEPSPLAFPHLIENCALNPERIIVPAQRFIGSTTGTIVPCVFLWKYVMHAGSVWSDVHGTGQIECRETAIDDLRLAPDCMKIDAEGYEGAVLRGAERTIREHRPLLFLEVHKPDLARGETLGSLMDFIKYLGYECFSFDGERVDDFTTRPQALDRIFCEPKNGHR